MFVLGLTGSIGMGKSVTAAMFRAKGVPVHDADAAVHKLLAGRAAPLVEAAFPGVVRDGRVDRARLSERVLGTSQALARLERILHPMVAEDRDRFASRARASGARLAVFDIPLLFETGGELICDAVAVVTAAAKIQRERVLARPGMTRERFEALLARQMPDPDKRRRAHAVIRTDGGMQSARNQVDDLLRALAACHGRR